MAQTFRLFISSTFDDFRRERELLQTQVFPEIKKYCSSKGYTFQPIDLRWGVNQEAQLDQKTLELCLNEVRACKTYPHPNFLVMLGDRYGWIPLPYTIEKQEFESLLEEMPDVDRQYTLEWYKEDLNQIPVSYILKERRGEFEEHDIWQSIEDKLRNVLQQSAKKTLDEEKQRKYFLSATEAEVEEGIIPYIKPTEFQKTLIARNSKLQDVDPKYIFGFLRDVDKTSVRSERFICDDFDEANSFKQRVKQELLDENILTTKTTQINDDSLDENYLNEFASTITTFLKRQIDSNILQQKEVTPLEVEIGAQHYFARQKRQNFLGREKILQEIADYIEGDSNKPLVVYGRSGLGKSSLMAMAIKQAEDEADKQVCYRFVGATPNSSSSKQILISIFDQLGIDLRSYLYLDKEQQILLQDDKQNNFEDFSKQVYKTFVKVTEPTVIFIDAVDQLGNSDQFIWLPKALPANVKIVISALDDKKYINDSNYFQSLKAKTENIYEILDFGEPVKLLYALLNNENRTVQKHQEEYFLRQYSSSASPLYISIAVQEMRNWKSFDSVVGDELTSDGEMQSLADTQQGIIQKYISNLSKLYHHNKALVQRALGYIYASKDGLSESEILQLLSINEDFIKQVAPSTWHENKSCDLPVVIWTRLYTHLRAFLSLKIQDGEGLLYFFHREFEDVVSLKIL